MTGHDLFDFDYLAKMLAKADPDFASLKREDGANIYWVDSRAVMTVVNQLMAGVHSGQIKLVPTQ